MKSQMSLMYIALGDKCFIFVCSCFYEWCCLIAISIIKYLIISYENRRFYKLLMHNAMSN